VKFDEAKEIAKSYHTCARRVSGPMTIAMLMRNTMDAAWRAVGKGEDADAAVSHDIVHDSAIFAHVPIKSDIFGT